MSITVYVEGLSNYVNQIIENQGVRPLADGRILLGRQYLDDNRTPNSIVMVPRRTNFGYADVSSTADSTGQGRNAQIRQRTLRSKEIVFDVHVWGAAFPPDENEDWDMTEYLYETVIRAAHQIASSDSHIIDGVWVDQEDTAVNRERLGHYFVFQIGVRGPVAALPVNLVPTGTRINPAFPTVR